MTDGFIDPMTEGQSADEPLFLDQPHIPDYSNIKSLKKYLRPDRIYPEGTVMANGYVIGKNTLGRVEPTVLRPMYPRCLYNRTEEPREVKNAEQEKALVAQGWFHTPAEAGYKPPSLGYAMCQSVIAKQDKAEAPPPSAADKDALKAEIMKEIKADITADITKQIAKELLASLLSKSAEPQHDPVREQLLVEAGELGIRIDNRWSDQTLLKEIERSRGKN